MKKLFVMLCAAVALFSCTKEYPVTEEPMASPMTFNLTVSHAEADATKALKSGWENGDVVYVFFKDIAQKYLKLSYDGTAWTTTECNTEPGGPKFKESDFLGITDPDDKRMTAVYIPYYDVSVTYDNTWPGFYFNDGDFIATYFMSAESDYTVSGKDVSGELKLQKPYGFVQFFVPNIPEAEAPLYRLREENLVPAGCSGVPIGGGAFRVNSWDGYCLQGFPYKGGVLFAGELTSADTPTDYAFQLVKYVSATKACAEGTYETKATAKTIDAGVVVRFPETTNTSAWTYGKWVDMGPAGRWATGNLTDDGGTTKGEANIVAPDEAGKYYAWGETVGYAPSGTVFSHSFDWASYQHGHDLYKLTKYCNKDTYGNEGFTDTLTELTADDDAATKNLGSAWRMPTKAERDLLLDTAEFDWVWQDVTTDGYAIGGRLVTSQDTGLSMFLPAAGYGEDSSLKQLGSNGDYWSSALNTSGNPSYAYSIAVRKDEVNFYKFSRLRGNSVRAVKVTE